MFFLWWGKINILMGNISLNVPYKVQIMKNKHLENMRKARDRKRLNDPLPDYPVILKGLRCRITIEQFDFEYKKNVLELYASPRIDCYKVYSNGKFWKWKIGMSKILEAVRKSMPRVRAM